MLVFRANAPPHETKKKPESTVFNLPDRHHSRSIDAKIQDMSTLLISSPVEAAQLSEDCSYVSRSMAGSVPNRTRGPGVYAPLLKMAALYSLGIANCFPAWQAIADSMPTTGLLLAGVSCLLMVCSFEVAAWGSPFEDEF